MADINSTCSLSIYLCLLWLLVKSLGQFIHRFKPFQYVYYEVVTDSQEVAEWWTRSCKPVPSFPQVVSYRIRMMSNLVPGLGALQRSSRSLPIFTCTHFYVHRCSSNGAGLLHRGAIRSRRWRFGNAFSRRAWQPILSRFLLVIGLFLSAASHCHCPADGVTLLHVGLSAQQITVSHCFMWGSHRFPWNPGPDAWSLSSWSTVTSLKQPYACVSISCNSHNCQAACGHSPSTWSLFLHF